jgi:hypothetical protein
MKPNNGTDLASLQRAMADIRDGYRGDPEAAHSAEDNLTHHVLRLVAEGHPQAADLAAEMLKAAEWDVPRWCA